MKKIVPVAMMAILCMSAQAPTENDIAMTKCTKPAIDNCTSNKCDKPEEQMQPSTDSSDTKTPPKRLGAAKRITEGSNTTSVEADTVRMSAAQKIRAGISR